MKRIQSRAMAVVRSVGEKKSGGLVLVLLIAAALAGVATPRAAWALQADADRVTMVVGPSLKAGRTTAAKAGLIPSAEMSLAVRNAEEAGLTVYWAPDANRPLGLRGADLSAPRVGMTGLARTGDERQDAQAVLAGVAPVFGFQDAQEEFQTRDPEADGMGGKQVRADQVYAGLPVFGGQMIVHFDKEGKPFHVNGNYMTVEALDTAPTLTGEAALQAAVKDLSGRSLVVRSIQKGPELAVFAYQCAPILAYDVILECVDPEVGDAPWRYWIDASTGEVLMGYCLLQSVLPPTSSGAHVKLTGSLLAGEGGMTTNVTGWRETGSGTCYLYNTNSAWIITNAATSGYSDNAFYAYRAGSDWGASDRVEFSAANNIQWVQQYFQAVHGRSSFDANRSRAILNVHYGTSLVNAYWTGTGILIGDGNGVQSAPLAVLDVIGHEYAHAVTERSAGLIYAYESGALNESFSDIFGACVEFFAQQDGRVAYPGKVAGKADWLIGEDCWMLTTALRDLRNPRNAGTVGTGVQPSRYKGANWYTGSGDNGGVHYNGGPQSFMFHLLSEGGSGTNDGMAYSVTGIGWTNAQRIAYRALTLYLTPYSDYFASMLAWRWAARDLNPAWESSVLQAWNAVGIGPGAASSAIGTAVNSPGLTWQTGDDAGWTVQSAVTKDGYQAARSGVIGNNSNSWVYTTLAGPGTLSFWWKVSSEAGFDKLLFSIDARVVTNISGGADWKQLSLVIPAGTHVVRWNYVKDSSVSSGSDAGWLDMVQFEPAAHPGTVQLGAATYSVNENGGSVTITATRTGGSSGAASVNYATANETAAAGSDYTARNGTLTWAAGDAASKTFTVSIQNDAAYEGNETFTVTLSGATGATLGSPASATVTIVDTVEAIGTPTTPAGPSAGLTNQALVFSTGGATSSGGHAVQYRFGWGNGTLSPWTAGMATGTWSAAGTYSIVAQARCISGHATSAWSAARTVTITNTPAGVLGASAAWLDVPVAMISGRTYRVRVAMRNTGTVPWNLAGNFKLGSEMPANTYRWGLARVQVTNTVAPGAVQVFEFDVTPRELGSRPFAWRMVKEGDRWFGATNGSVVTVSAAAFPVALKINCGGPAYAGGWLADAGNVAGQAYAVASSIANAGAVTQAVYQSCRYGPGAASFGYSFPAVPNGNYRIKLHFSEPLWTTAGVRLFNVDVEGKRQLSSLDVARQAGGRNRALVVDLSSTVQDGNGLQLQFTAVKDCAMVSGIEISQESVSLPRINCGGSAVGDFAADRGGVGGQAYQATSSIVGAGVAPQALYQTCRYGPAGAWFGYSLADVPNGSYKVRLHFSEPVWQRAGQRLFDVVIEGTRKEAGLDVWSQAGGINRALVKECVVTVADGNGLQIVFTNVTKDCAMVSGIEVMQASGAGGVAVHVGTTGSAAFSASGTPRALALPEEGNGLAQSLVDVVTSGNVSENATGWEAVDQSMETAWIGKPGADGWWIALVYEPEITMSELSLTLGEQSVTNVQCLYSQDADQWADFRVAAAEGPVTVRYLWLVFPADGSERVPVVLEVEPKGEPQE